MYHSPNVREFDFITAIMMLCAILNVDDAFVASGFCPTKGTTKAGSELFQHLFGFDHLKWLSPFHHGWSMANLIYMARTTQLVSLVQSLD